jgi:hypothetical protein
LIQDKEGHIDAILVPGDLVAHGIPLDPADPSAGNYDLLKQTIAAVAHRFS